MLLHQVRQGIWNEAVKGMSEIHDGTNTHLYATMNLNLCPTYPALPSSRPSVSRTSSIEAMILLDTITSYPTPSPKPDEAGQYHLNHARKDGLV